MSAPTEPRITPTLIHSRHVTSFFEQLDRIGFDVGRTRISLWTALVTLVVIVFTVLLARIGSRLAKWGFGHITRLAPAQQLLGEKLVSLAVWIVAGLMAIDVLGISLTALTVFSGAFGLAIGFGLQKTFGNLIAGIILLMDGSIKPGDVIAVTDSSGKDAFGQIRKIGIRAVSVTTRDQREYLIPNENLMVNQVENWSYSSRNVRMQVHVGVSYKSDMARVEALMLEAAASCHRVLRSPPPTVWMSEYADNALNFIIHCWITDPEEGVGNVRSEVLKKLWWLFKENGIEIPFPQRDLNLRDGEAVRALIAALQGDAGQGDAGQGERGPAVRSDP